MTINELRTQWQENAEHDTTIEIGGGKRIQAVKRSTYTAGSDCFLTVATLMQVQDNLP